ncbi:MAG TPA: hypothetical protein VFN22_02915 [Gemmatimonadales bacterium]|nr:hypothetical protein [Gemmatimonadales bacterium]
MRAATVVLTLLALSACSGTPSGPGAGGGGPTGSIYITWNAEGDARPQVYRVSVPDGNYEQVVVPYHSIGPDFDVDHDGSGLLFQPPAPKLAWMPGFDPSRLVEPVKNGYRLSPRISPDLNSIASVIVEQFIPREIRILDMRTGVERLIGTMPRDGGYSLDHWFAGGDSLLVSWSGFLGRQEYYIAQADGSGVTPFDFPLERHASYLAISPDERRLAISNPRISDSLGYATDTIQIADINPPRLVRSLGLPYRVGQLAWSPDGRYLAHIGAGSYIEDGKTTVRVLEIIDVESGERTALITIQDPGTFARRVRWARN